MIEIRKIESSRLPSTDFSALEFGKAFSDHMLICEFKNGEWGTATILPYQELNYPLSLHALHYGQAAFEGMKAYRQINGDIALFRPKMNFERLNRSAVRLAMPEVPEDVFMDGLKKLIDLDREWVPKEEGMSLYIRPFLFSSSSFIAARPSESYTFAIITSPVGPYYTGNVKVKIEEQYTRSAAGGIGFTKAAGNYGGAFYPTRKAVEKGYTQIIWTDHKDHRLIEESGTMNIMFRIGGTMRTPPLSERILAGITRDSILSLLRSWGEIVEERPITVDEVVYAAENNYLEEAFGMGTAAVVSPISTIGFRERDFEVPNSPEGIAVRIKKALNEIRTGKVADENGWMLKV
jgi:branched-chain amino acid aminotransferase